MTDQRLPATGTAATDPSNNQQRAGSGSPDRLLRRDPVSLAAAVAEYRRLTYRALVLQAMHTALPPVWQANDDDGTNLLSLDPPIGVGERVCVSGGAASGLRAC